MEIINLIETQIILHLNQNHTFYEEFKVYNFRFNCQTFNDFIDIFQDNDL